MFHQRHCGLCAGVAQHDLLRLEAGVVEWMQLALWIPRHENGGLLLQDLIFF